MRKLTATYIEASELFKSLGFEELGSDFWCCDLRFTFVDLDLPLVRMNAFLEELEFQFQLENKTAEFVALVKKLPDYDPHMYVDIEN
jgi:hypothetical protein